MSILKALRSPDRAMKAVRKCGHALLDREYYKNASARSTNLLSTWLLRVARLARARLSPSSCRTRAGPAFVPVPGARARAESRDRRRSGQSGPRPTSPAGDKCQRRAALLGRAMRKADFAASVRRGVQLAFTQGLDQARAKTTCWPWRCAKPSPTRCSARRAIASRISAPNPPSAGTGSRAMSCRSSQVAPRGCHLRFQGKV